MDPHRLGKKYDKISAWWQEHHIDSNYGVDQVKRALKFLSRGGNALDVGCGVGGRLIHLLEKHDLKITGVDVSTDMIRLAQHTHPQHTFVRDDICTWKSTDSFDFIVAWDSLFHLPLAMQAPVLHKLCQWLKSGGVLIYSFGDAQGEHVDQWRNDSFYYSSIGIKENLRILIDNGLSIAHLELDQYPERHVYLIARKV